MVKEEFKENIEVTKEPYHAVHPVRLPELFLVELTIIIYFKMLPSLKKRSTIYVGRKKIKIINR